MSPESETVSAAGAVRAAIDLDRLPWIRPLVAAYVNNFSSVAALFAGNPADPAAWRDVIRRVASSSRDRAALTSMLQAQLSDRDAPVEARTNASRLAEAGSVAIVTGQQAGLFGGPLYTLLKAVSTIQIARRVAAEHEVPVVPVFWVEGDDHDWTEVRSTVVLDAEGLPRAIALPDPEGAGAQPVSQVRLDDRIDVTLEALRESLQPTEFTAALLTSLGERYGRGTTLSRALASWLDALLGPFGLVVFEASDPQGKRLAADVFAHEIEAGGAVTPLAREAADTLRALGHTPQVEPASDATGLFYVNAKGRQSIKRQDGDWIVGSETRSSAELLNEARTHPERFSPNVLLRPIVQDRIFPTAAYVGGPSELAYQAQLGGAYRAFGVEPPLICPRTSATLLDAAAGRFLDRSGIPFEALQAQDESALNARLQELLPPSFDQLLERIDQQITEGLDRVRDVATSIDPTLSGAVETTSTRVRETLKTLQGKVVQAAKRKDDTLRRQFQRTQALIFPGGSPQERSLGVAWCVNRYGPSVVTRLLDVLPADPGRHYLLVL